MHKKQQIQLSPHENYPEKREISWLRRNVFKNLNAHGGYTPAASAPPNTINPEQVRRHHRAQWAGVKGGKDCPLPHLTCAFISYPEKEITIKEPKLFIIFA